MAAVHVRYVRSGGFAGLRMVADVDTAQLAEANAAEASRLEALASAAAAEPAAPAPDRPRPDGYQHDVTITAGGATVERRGWDGAMPPELEALVSALAGHLTPT